MQRAIAVSTHEDDREKVERAAEVALDSEARLAVRARSVIHGQLGHAEAEMMREHRDEAMALAVELDVLEHFGAVRLKPAVHVVELHTGRYTSRAVVDLRDEAPHEWVLPVALPTGHEVIALVELREQIGNLGCVVLEIGVHRDDDVALCDGDPGIEGRCLSE